MAEKIRVHGTGILYIEYDDALTRDVVLSKKWRKAAICKGYVTLEIKNGSVLEFHRYPALESARIKPLRNLLMENKIQFSDFTGSSGAWYTPPPEKKERQFVPKTRAEYAEKRREGMMAAAARVLDYKAREADRKTWANPEEDAVNDALSSSEEREVDCW